MRGSQAKLVVLMAAPLLGLCHAAVAVGETTMPNRPVVPVIPKPALAPPFPIVKPSVPVPSQDTLPGKPDTPSSGVKPQAETSSIQAEPYRLTAGDRFAVTIANIPEFSGQYQVQVDGTVTFPSLGVISIWGLTVHQIAGLLTTRYVQAEILRDPDITVGLLTVSPLKVALSGEVNRPGSYDLASADGKLPTLTTAIQKAGGITGLADLRKIKLLRARRSSADDAFEVDLWALLQSGDLRQDITLRDGDSIIVATATTPIDPTEAGLIGAATVSPAFMQVGVLGETRQSGVVQVPPNTPLNQVLLAAGGFNNRARKGSVELIRLNRDGTVVRRKIRVDFSSGINEATNPVLRNRDVVLVGRNFIAALSDNLTAILGPVNQTVSVFTLFKTLFPASSGSGSTVIIPSSGGTTTVTPTTTAPTTTAPTTTTP